MGRQDDTARREVLAFLRRPISSTDYLDTLLDIAADIKRGAQWQDIYERYVLGLPSRTVDEETP